MPGADRYAVAQGWRSELRQGINAGWAGAFFLIGGVFLGAKAFGARHAAIPSSTEGEWSLAGFESGRDVQHAGLGGLRSPVNSLFVSLFRCMVLAANGAKEGTLRLHGRPSDVPPCGWARGRAPTSAEGHKVILGLRLKSTGLFAV